MSDFIAFTTCSVFTSSTFISSVPFGTTVTAFMFLVVTIMLFLKTFGDQNFDFVSDDFFEMVSLVVNDDGNSTFNSS